MSDTWYREPVTIPPYTDELGRTWNHSGTPANQAAQMAHTPPPSFLDQWPEDLHTIALQAALAMELRDLTDQWIDEHFKKTGEGPRGILGLDAL